MTEKLLSCPFCQGEAILESNKLRYGTIYSAYCQKCGAEITGFSEHEAISAWNRRAQPENEPLTRCENCTHWDKSISFMISAHACSYWSPSKRSPRYTEGFEFCSFASAKPERSEGE